MQLKSFNEILEAIVKINPDIAMLTTPMQGMLVGIYSDYSHPDFDDFLSRLIEDIKAFDTLKLVLVNCLNTHLNWGLEK